MERMIVDEKSYYQEKYENNGYIITSLPYAFLIWSKEPGDRDYPIMTVNTLDEAKYLTD